MTLAIAHRGEPEGHRENTLASFAAAVACGADMVEIDLQCSADGEIVVVHDDTLDHLWDRPVAVDALAWAEFRELGAGEVRIPHLAQVFEAVPVGLMVDFTGPEVVAGALSCARAAGAMERCLFVTGHVDALRQLRALAPEARIGLTWVEEPRPTWELLAELRAETWNPWWPLARPDDVAALHAQGYQVSCWTVDEAEDMATVIDAGVDAVVSNRIAELRSVLDRRL